MVLKMETTSISVKKKGSSVKKEDKEKRLLRGQEGCYNRNRTLKTLSGPKKNPIEKKERIKKTKGAVRRDTSEKEKNLNTGTKSRKVLKKREKG